MTEKKINNEKLIFDFIVFNTVFEHPPPYTIEKDWAHEIYDSNGVRFGSQRSYEDMLTIKQYLEIKAQEQNLYGEFQ